MKTHTLRKLSPQLKRCTFTPKFLQVILAAHPETISLFLSGFSKLLKNKFGFSVVYEESQFPNFHNPPQIQTNLAQSHLLRWIELGLEHQASWVDLEQMIKSIDFGVRSILESNKEE